MTDGAAKLLESLPRGMREKTKDAFDRLTSKDKNKFWTSGQWMTERGGNFFS